MRVNRRWLTRSCLAAGLLAAPRLNTAAEADPNPTVHLGFEDGATTGWRTSKLAQPYSGTVVSEPVRSGKYAMRFELRAGDSPGGDGIRAELKEQHLVPLRREIWYSFSTFIPASFPRWKDNSVISQWKGSTDEGEYDDRSPILAHRYWDHALVIDIRHSSTPLQQGNDGERSTLLRIPNFPRGVWHDFRYRIVWAHDEGEIDCWLNGKQVIRYRGPAGYNDTRGPYFKLGLYHHNGGNEPFVIYHDEYKRGFRREDVD
ncbi:MAG: polysaccharide lyase [Acidobacteria bacterium]|nr:polysaccharide lyase [Acidobacteriota bacterium]